MPPAARITDATAHGGKIVKGEPTVLIGGLPAARVGDPHVCPMVNGPVVHIGGVINTGSVTVLIGGALAARIGDQCHCQTVGAAGAGVPRKVGPGAGETTWQGRYGEMRLTDTDHDGTLDTAEGGVRAIRHNDQYTVDVDGFHVEGRNTVDIFYAEAGGTARGNCGGTLQHRAEAGVIRERGSLRLGRQNDSDSPFTNPFVAMSWNARSLRVAEEGGALVGDDGVRVGLGSEGHATGDLLSGDVTLETNLPFLPRSVTGAVSLSLGAGLNEHIYYDRRDGQVHLVLGGEWAWLGLEGDQPITPSLDQIDMVVDEIRGVIDRISGGAAPPPPPPVIPNTIASGDFNVLIGG